MNLNKDFENLELRLQNLREESQDIFRAGEEQFAERYEKLLEDVFPRDVLWAKAAISALWQIEYVDQIRLGNNPELSDIFEKKVAVVLSHLPLSSENKADLTTAIVWISSSKKELRENYFSETWFEYDTLFPIIEGLLAEGDISPEEYSLIERWYKESWNMTESLWKLPENIRNIVLEDIGAYTTASDSSRDEAFHSEYYQELAELHGAWYDVFPIKRFLSKSYYRNPGRLRKREHPARRLRRTYKMALLRILKMRFGSIDAEKLLRQFDECKTFQEMFLLLYKLFEVLWENDENTESFIVVEEANIIEKIVLTAEQTKEKILEWEKITADISSLISDTDAEIEQWILEEILDDDTHFHGDEILFSHGEEKDMAGAYSESSHIELEEDEEETAIIQSGDTLSWKYEALKEHFHKIDDDKRKAFLEWEFERVDEINLRLVSVQSKIEKIAKLLGEEI